MNKKKVLHFRSLDGASEQQNVDLKRQLQVIEQEASVLRAKTQSLEADNEKLQAENKKMQVMKCILFYHTYIYTIIFMN